MDRRQEPIEIDRLRKPAVGSNRGNVLARTGGRDDDDRNRREPGIACLALAEFPAVHHRHHQVEDDDARLAGFIERVERQLAVRGGAHVETLELQEPPEHFAGVAVVFDDHDRRHGAQAVRRSLACVMRAVRVA